MKIEKERLQEIINEELKLMENKEVFMKRYNNLIQTALNVAQDFKKIDPDRYSVLMRVIRILARANKL